MFLWWGPAVGSFFPVHRGQPGVYAGLTAVPLLLLLAVEIVLMPTCIRFHWSVGLVVPLAFGVTRLYVLRHAFPRFYFGHNYMARLCYNEQRSLSASRWNEINRLHLAARHKTQLARIREKNRIKVR
ncbi:unnamed protein product [Amoebophrya sp. A25]|nr:unnamed protein product [Amoebophrya sp. A25]|eukprot:GSA25T00008099001.1